MNKKEFLTRLAELVEEAVDTYQDLNRKTSDQKEGLIEEAISWGICAIYLIRAVEALIGRKISITPLSPIEELEKVLDEELKS
ncbi:hypothetical protein Thein_1509 [Thermodesulfatator indicus DSM 15286]|uniref:Uncharacterized protein n=1 Tax=Thermodesulfatator indicus (strain DSM 15286 / JCM 11887 / CIR29812) TaxID=667014 RepID=F8AAF0_THEID|nr:hypothetical protein [Thermodesulfatator indicus]AEH45370.1 hypothetical protein Thein_1509 [Thermodesulfatator indicus DSM 15286]